MRRMIRSTSLVLLALFALAGCDDPAPDDVLSRTRAEQAPEIVDAAEVLSSADVATLDPAKMTRAEVEKALGSGQYCSFSYASFSEPVLAVSTASTAATGVIKLNGKLVVLEAVSSGEITELSAGPIQMRLAPAVQNRQAGAKTDAVVTFQISDQLRADYRGYMGCTG